MGGSWPDLESRSLSVLDTEKHMAELLRTQCLRLSDRSRMLMKAILCEKSLDFLRLPL